MTSTSEYFLLKTSTATSADPRLRLNEVVALDTLHLQVQNPLTFLPKIIYLRYSEIKHFW